MILVTGATGKVGAEQVRALVDADVGVRAPIRRDEDTLRLPDGPEIGDQRPQ
jgi:uncharacterized protein YbjT (DUF2867 family)